jgi:hypothetical protein
LRPRPGWKTRSGWFCTACVLLIAARQISVAQESAATKSNQTQTQTNTTQQSTSHKSKSQPASTRGKHSSRRRTSARGQQKIDSQRAQQIQQALIREHYLSGAASGTWNQASEDAMRRYQSDHGWQAKTVPDARALISLGLGPNHDHLLNPESAMTTEPKVTAQKTIELKTSHPSSASTASNSPASLQTPSNASAAKAQPDAVPAAQVEPSDPSRPQ